MSGHTVIKLQIDPLTLLSLAAFLAAAVYLLNELAELLMLRRRRRKRSPELSLQHCDAVVIQGKQNLLF